MDTSAIIVSAGSSTRMNGQNKQYLKIGNNHVIGLSMLAFEKAESISEIIVVVKKEDISFVKDIAIQLNITKFKVCVEGGETRQESVFNGVKYTSSDCSLIAIHDGARPLIKTILIENTINDARVFGAATLGVNVKDTIKIVSDNLIVDTPYRPHLFITQTPQVFKKSLYIKGLNFATEYKLDFTDDCQLVESIGVKVFMTKGDYKNIKITTPEDILIANLLYNLEENEVPQ